MGCGRRRLIGALAWGTLARAGYGGRRVGSDLSGGSIGAKGRAVVTIYPSLRVSANGAAVLLDAVGKGFSVVSIPDLAVRFAGTYEDAVDLTLSGFGESLGIRTLSDELVVVRGGDQQSHPLPRAGDRIRGFAVSDAGDRLALALGGEIYGEPGSLEVWSLPAGAAPLAAATLPAIDRAVVSGSPGFSRISLAASTSDGAEFRAVYTVPDGDGGELTPLWPNGNAAAPGGAVALSDEWTWIARADGLAGLRDGEERPVTLPGTAFERLLYSPTGSHLLASRVERVVGVTDAAILFRLFDLATLTETARATHVIEHDGEAHPVVSPDWSLLILRATRAGEVAVQEYELGRPV
jgi:hypothetical protein